MSKPPTSTQSPVFGLPEIALICVTFIWGGTFLVVHNAVAQSGPLGFVGSRFAVAASIAALCSYRHLRGISLFEIRAGCLIGISIFAGYSLQTLGLQHISGSKSAFITAFYVPIVPLLQWAVQRKAPRAAVWAGVAIAFLGLACLAGPDGLRGGFGYGELLTALGALAISAEIILISIFARQVNIVRVTVLQLAVASLTAFIFVPISGEGMPALSTTFIVSAVALGSASALIQYVMNWAQQRIAATKATLIYAGEPIWAGVIGKIAGDSIPALAVLGAALIIGASIISEWRPKRRAEVRY